MPFGAIHQDTASSRRRPAVPGVIADVSKDNENDVVINRDPDAAEVYTLLIDTATDAEEYGVNLTDPQVGSCVFTSGAGTTKILIAAGVAAAWNAVPANRGIAAAVSDGVATVTFTGVYPGVEFTMEEDENAAKMTLTNTVAAASAIPVPFGRAMIASAFVSGNSKLGVLAALTALTAQVDTLTVIYEAAESYTVHITIQEQMYSVTVAADTNTNTTATAIRLALNSVMPANTVLVSGATDQIILTAEVAGKGFETSFGLTVSPDVNFVLVNTTGGVLTDFNRAFVGISTYSYDTDQVSLSAESAEYAANAGVNVLQRGKIWVENTETITLGADVYVELSTAADLGKFFAASSATRIKVNRGLLSWQRSDHAASGAWAASDGNIAVLGISLAA